MIGILILNELLSYMKRYHFYLLTLILLLLFVINGIFYSHEYVELKEYYGRKNDNVQNAATYQQIRFPPSPNLFCSSNNVNLSSILFWVRLDQLSISQSNEEKGNQYLPVAQPMDWTFIVQIIFSILIVMISYNAITGEKETKTLALICSNSVSRFQIYLSKFCSLFLVSSCILLLSMLSGLLTILIIGQIPVDSILLGQLVIFFILSMLYGSIFILIGMGSSVLTHNSTLSLLTAIAMWLFLVVVLPESIEIAVKSTQKNPSNYELRRMYAPYQFGLGFDLYGEIEKSIAAKKEYSESEKEQAIEEAKNKMITIYNDHVMESRNIIDYIMNVHISRYRTQQRWKLLSPVIVFRSFSEKLFYGGSYKFLNLFEQINQYSKAFHDDLYSKYNARSERFSSLLVEINGEEVRILPDKPKFENNGMEFQAHTPTLREKLSVALGETVLMILLCLTLGIFGFIRFVGYDVR